MNKYIDLQIKDDDLVLDSAGIPILITDRDVIAQDIRHVIRESGLLFELIGERRTANRKLVHIKIKTLVESDERVTPGSCSITEESATKIIIFAETEFGPINVTGVTE